MMYGMFKTKEKYKEAVQNALQQITTTVDYVKKTYFNEWREQTCVDFVAYQVAKNLKSCGYKIKRYYQECVIYTIASELLKWPNFDVEDLNNHAIECYTCYFPVEFFEPLEGGEKIID